MEWNLQIWRGNYSISRLSTNQVEQKYFLTSKILKIRTLSQESPGVGDLTKWGNKPRKKIDSNESNTKLWGEYFWDVRIKMPRWQLGTNRESNQSILEQVRKPSLLTQNDNILNWIKSILVAKYGMNYRWVYRKLSKWEIRIFNSMGGNKVVWEWKYLITVYYLAQHLY